MTTSTATLASASIRAEAARRNISQTQLAERIGMSQSAFSRRMNGSQPWDLDDLDKLAALFEMSTRDLIPTSAVSAAS